MYHVSSTQNSTFMHPKVSAMVQEQANILAKKARLPRGSSDIVSRIDRVANASVARNVRSLVASGDYQLVTELLRSASSLSLVPFVAALRSLMVAHRSDELNDLLRLMRSKSILPPSSVFSAVVTYFATSARHAQRSSSSKSMSSSTSKSTSSATQKPGRPAKSATTEAQRAQFFFADLKTAYVPAASAYEAMWLLLPMNASEEYTITAAHEALWKEMQEAGVFPTDRMFMTVLRSLRFQFKKHPSNIAKRKTLSAHLEDFSLTCRNTFGSNPSLLLPSVSSSSASNPHNSVTSSPHQVTRDLSGTLSKQWIATVVAIQGSSAAFDLVASMYEVSEEGSLPLKSTTLLESAATIRAHAEATMSEPMRNPHMSDVFVIPTKFCPYEPLIDVLAERGENLQVIQAWNKMTPGAKLGAAPSTIAAVALASDPSHLSSLFESFPTLTKADPYLLLTMFSLSKAVPTLQRSVLDFLATLPVPIAATLAENRVFEQGAKIFGDSPIAEQFMQLQETLIPQGP